MEQNAKYERAKKRAEELKGFYSHLLAYILVNAFLIIVNRLTSPGLSLVLVAAPRLGHRSRHPRGDHVPARHVLGT